MNKIHNFWRRGLPWALGLSAALSGTLSGTASQAAVQFFDSEAQFLAALGGVQREGFERFASDLDSSGRGLDLGAFVVNGVWRVETPPGPSGVDGSAFLALDLSYGGWAELKFGAAQRAFGAWFSQVPVRLSADANSLEGYGSYRLVSSLEPAGLPGGAPQFIGWIADQSFNRVVLEGAGCCSRRVALDEIRFVGASAVPEPGAFALMLAGLAGLGWRGRRRAR